MRTRFATILAVSIVLPAALGGCTGGTLDITPKTGPNTILRIATFNLEDVRTEQLLRSDDPKLTAAAVIIQRLHPDIILLNEVAYDHGDPPGQNGQRFADRYLAVSQGEGLEPIKYQAFMAPSNTGISSGLDLNNDGTVTVEPEEADEGRAYGDDCWGFGTFPGQYSMTVLVREGIEIDSDNVRTFQTFRWSQMPDALRPVDPATNESWYSDEEWGALRLSSKSHWDVPVRLPNGTIIHCLCSHPTPPVFDGPEDRNGCRNHDEIRFWADYLSGKNYIIDDAGKAGGLADEANFVILGDLNSDPDKGEGVDYPISKFLLKHPRVQGDFVPRAAHQSNESNIELEDDDTAGWGMRADYVLPSVGLEIVDGGVHRTASNGKRVSDHFPVWIDVISRP